MFSDYDTVDLNKRMVAYQNSLDTCKPGSAVYRYYCEMIIGIAKELKVRYAFGNEMLDRKYAGV